MLGSLTWYVNGVVDAVTPVTQAVSDSSLPLTIGSGYAGGYVGGIDEVAVYSRALTAGEVLEHFEAVGDQAAYGLLVAGGWPGVVLASG